MSWLSDLRDRLWRRRRATPSRAMLIDRKHRLEGDIQQLNRRVNAGVSRGENVGDLQARLERLRAEHLQTRLEIDRTPH